MVFILTSKAIHPVYVALTEDDVRACVAKYLAAYDRWRSATDDVPAGDAWRATLKDTTAWLWDRLMDPVVKSLTELCMNRAILVPTGLLVLLPLHAAGRGDIYPPLHMTYIPNARALTAVRRTLGAFRGPHKLLAISDPDGSLDFAFEETIAALDTFPRSNRLCFAGSKAALKRVKDNLTRYDIWHFSTHGWAGWSEPLDSALLLANGEHLTLRELLSLHAPARLVVLSACETGVSGTDLPDEVIGLPTGLLKAGVAGVVGSLWAVHDFSTAILMIRFYEAWRESGQAPADALDTAQRWLRSATNSDFKAYFKHRLPEFAEGRLPVSVASRGYRYFVLADPGKRPFAHPFYWAGFYYTGA